MTSADQLENFSGLLNRDTESLLAGLDKTKQAAEDAGRAIASLTSELSNAVSATQIGNILERLQTLASNPFLSSKERAKIEGLIPQAREKMAYMETQELIQVFRGEGPDPRLDPLGASTYHLWTREEQDFYREHSDPNKTYTAQAVDENGNAIEGTTISENGEKLGRKIAFLNSIRTKDPKYFTAQEWEQLYEYYSGGKKPTTPQQQDAFIKNMQADSLTVAAFEIQNAGRNAEKETLQQGGSREEAKQAKHQAEEERQAQVPIDQERVKAIGRAVPAAQVEQDRGNALIQGQQPESLFIGELAPSASIAVQESGNGVSL